MRLLSGTRLRPKAILFDMDGTLVNSIALIERLWDEWAARHGLALSKVLEVAHGRPPVESMRLLVPGADHEREAAEYSRRELAQSDGVEAVAGALDLLRGLPGHRWCVVTSADRNLARARLHIAGLPFPELLIAVDDISRPKPDPEGYLKAASRLGFAAADCLVIEDAPPGFEAARGAGIPYIAVATTLPRPELERHDWIPDLAALRVAEADDHLDVTVV